MVWCHNLYADDMRTQITSETWQAAQNCREIDDRMQRLLCFDTLFDTPLTQIKPADTQEEESLPQTKLVEAQDAMKATRPIGQMIGEMERGRNRTDGGWITHIRQWQGEDIIWQGAKDIMNLSEAELGRGADVGKRTDIFMTMIEVANEVGTEQENGQETTDKAVLLLSCDNDITTLGLLLPRPIDTLTVSLSLSGSGGLSQRLNWRNVENGTLLIAGRGLESIDTIKAIAASPRIQFQVNYSQGSRAFVFNMHNLKEQLKPFRTACHW